MALECQQTRVKRAFKRETRLALMVFLGSFFLSQVDLFGVNTALRHISQDTAYKIAAPVIFRANPPKISVILITDDDLNILEQSWPIDHALLGDTIRDIADLQPQSLFVDFKFLDLSASKSTSDLIGSLGYAVEQFPTAIVDPASSIWENQLNNFPIKAETKSILSSIRSLSVEFVDSRIVEYDGLTAIMPGENNLSAAYFLYSAHCKAAKTCATNLFSGKEEIELVWRATPARCLGQAGQLRKECAKIPLRWWHRTWRVIIENTFPNQSDQSLRPPDLPYNTITLSQLFADPTKGELIKGSTVFLGGSMLAAGDFVLSPIYSPLPGIFGHAAYFDNLVSLGENSFDHALPLDGGLGYQTAIILFFTLLLWCGRMIAATSFMYHRSATGSVTLLGPSAFGSIIIVIASVFISILELFVFHVSPETWLVGPQLLVLSLIGDRFL